MAKAGVKAEEKLRVITECVICMNAFTDPRMLPCIHTFCFECLKRTSEAEQKKPGDKMPCPLCRKEFIIPKDGVNGVQKNFFMENLLEFKEMLQIGSATRICDVCNIRNEGKTGQIPTATMRCFECQDNYCDSCVKVHQFQKLSRNHQLFDVGSDMKPERVQIISMKTCTKHIQKPLDYYCADCKKIVCVSCFVETHKLHDCKDVTSVDEEFRETIEKKALKITNFINEMLLMRQNAEKGKADFMKEIIAKEKKIFERNKELKDMIDRHTKSLLDELSRIKSNRLKELEIQMEEIERCCTIMSSFETYCNELKLKGSASDICSSVAQLIGRADELEKDHEAFIDRPHQSVEVTFKAADLSEVLQKLNNNFVGNIKETAAQFKNSAIVVRFKDYPKKTKDVIKINLYHPNEISTLEQIPTAMQDESFAAVYCNTMYVTGVGDKWNEIWKYTEDSGWTKCASLVKNRRGHSAAFIDEVLYICGGYVGSFKNVLDSVEAYDTVTDKCSTVGKLVYCVYYSGNCVPFRSSLHIFGGLDEDIAIHDVQVYNTKQNTCTLLTKPMPRGYCMMRAVLLDSSVILIGWDTCFIYNIVTETWSERKQFKTDIIHFGLVLENRRIFVIGGASDGKDGVTLECRDNVNLRYVPLQNIIDDKPIEWKIHARLPLPETVCAYANMRFKV